jgi:hypothetical protein
MFGSVFPSTLLTLHRGQGSGRGLSPEIWHRHAGQALQGDGGNWYSAGDDFMNMSGYSPAISGTVNSINVSGYGVYTDTATSACSVAPIATEVGGVLRLSLGATDNHEAWITSGGNSGVLGVISDTAGSDKKLLFEARFRVGQVTEHGVFIGLAEEGLAAANSLVDDTGALASKDLIGFHIDTAGPTALDFVYRKAGQTAQVAIAGVKTIAASTWYKVGFVYDPHAEPAKRIKAYVDNVEQSAYITKTNIEAATFPDGEELAFLAGIKTGEAGAKTLDLDWWCFAQEGA